MKVIALRQLHGNYGTAATGDSINVNPDLAKSLLDRGLVCLPENYEKKVIAPAEQKQTRVRRSETK
jgi:hypothetical protein